MRPHGVAAPRASGRMLRTATMCLCATTVAGSISGCDLLDALRVRFTMHAERFDLSSGEFSELPAPEIKRNLFDVVATDDGLLVIGGLDKDGDWVSDVEHFDAATQTWSRRAPFPEPGLAWSLWVGDRLCVLGGYDALEAAVRESVWCYDPTQDFWDRGADLPRDYSSFYPVVLGGRIYIMGGTEVGNGQIASALDEVWSYDPLAESWTQHANMPARRGLAAVHALGDQIFVVGGWDKTDLSADEDQPEAGAMLAYTPASDTWSQMPQMPHARLLYGSDVVNGEIVVFFGVTDGPLVEIFNPDTQTWRAGTDPEVPLDAGVYSYVEADGQMYLLVLLDGIANAASVSSGKLWRYDPSTDAWSIAGTRDPSAQDALFLGAVWGDSILWVGANTKFSLEFEDDTQRSAPQQSAPRSPASRTIRLARPTRPLAP